jgi:hypothetical protein
MRKSKQKKIQPSGLLRIGFAFHSLCNVQECVSRLQARAGMIAIPTSPRQWGILKVTTEPVDDYSARFALRAFGYEIRGTLGQSGTSTEVTGRGHFRWDFYLFSSPFVIIGLGFIVFLLTAPHIPLLGVAYVCFWFVTLVRLWRHFQKKIIDIVIDALG